jgi:hypothetical protein
VILYRYNNDGFAVNGTVARYPNPRPQANECPPSGLRSYAFRGNHLSDDGCYGSGFSNDWIEDQLNRSYLDSAINPSGGREDLEQLPNGGAVLVEIYWNSDQLLGLPFFTWIANPIVAHVWAIYPVSSLEPDLD